MTLKERAQAHYPNNPGYQQQWLKMVQLLGAKWLLAAPIVKGTTS